MNTALTKALTQPPPQALRFSHGFTLRDERETRVTGDDAQGTMGGRP